MVNQAKFPVRLMCRLLRVSTSGFYAWEDRPLCEHERTDRALMQRIYAIHERSHGAYGSPNIHAELADDHGLRVGRKRVARLMRGAGIRGVTARRFVVTTQSQPGAKTAVDLVQRRFYAQAPNQLWVADATFIPTWAGFLYLAMVLDVYSRKIVGWAMGNSLNTQLMLDALNMAITQRQPKGVIHHSDRGCQYTSYAFGKRCIEAGIKPSMGSVGDAYDNAMAESFFATLEREIIDRHRFRSQVEARMAVFTWIESWYNPHRRHSSLGYRSPMNYERQALTHQAAQSLRHSSPLLPLTRQTALRVYT
jgi:putative transposase